MRSVWMTVCLAVFCVASHGDEKAKEATEKSVAASVYAPFVGSVPENGSGFVIKPPPGGTMKVLPDLNRKVLPSPTTPFRGLFRWRFKNAPLSLILREIQQAHKVRILLCIPPERASEDVKVTMWLFSANIIESLTKLNALGLVWRKNGDTYYVAWNENDLPPMQNAITPSPQ